MLTTAVSILQHTDLLRGLHIHETFDFDAIRTHFFEQATKAPYLCCHGYLCGNGHSSIFHVCFRVHTGRCLLERLEEAYSEMHRRTCVRLVENCDESEKLTLISRARYANGSLNTATDLLIAALPVRGIWRLQLVKRQRIALIGILSLGWL